MLDSLINQAVLTAKEGLWILSLTLMVIYDVLNGTARMETVGLESDRMRARWRRWNLSGPLSRLRSKN